MDDRAIKLFSNLIVLPERGPLERAKGERYLMAALLETAISDARQPAVEFRSRVANRRMARERIGARSTRHLAREWIRRGNVGTVTFKQACEYLGLDGGKIREAVR